MRKLTSFYEALNTEGAYEEAAFALAKRGVKKYLPGKTEEALVIAKSPAGDAEAVKNAIKSVVPIDVFESLRQLDPSFNRELADKFSMILRKSVAPNSPKGIECTPWLMQQWILGDRNVRDAGKHAMTAYVLGCYYTSKYQKRPTVAGIGDIWTVQSLSDFEPALEGMPSLEKIQGKEAVAAAGSEIAIRAELGSYAYFIEQKEIASQPIVSQKKHNKDYSGEIVTPGVDYDLIGMEGNCIAVCIKTQAAATRVAIGSPEHNSTDWCTSWPDGSHLKNYLDRGILVALYLFDGQANPNKEAEHKWQANFGVKASDGDQFKKEDDGAVTIGYENENTPAEIANIPETLRMKVADFVIQESGVDAEKAYQTSKLLNYWDPRKWPSHVLEGMSVPEMLELYGLYENKNCELDNEKKIVYVTDPEYVYEDKTNFGEPSKSF